MSYRQFSDYSQAVITGARAGPQMAPPHCAMQDWGRIQPWAADPSQASVPPMRFGVLQETSIQLNVWDASAAQQHIEEDLHTCGSQQDREQVTGRNCVDI